VSDRLGLGLWSGFGFAGGLEALLAWHASEASNIRAHDRERIRSIAYQIRPHWSGHYTNVASACGRIPRYHAGLRVSDTHSWSYL
jgi:hypothetical protein